MYCIYKSYIIYKTSCIKSNCLLVLQNCATNDGVANDGILDRFLPRTAAGVMKGFDCKSKI